MKGFIFLPRQSIGVRDGEMNCHSCGRVWKTESSRPLLPIRLKWSFRNFGIRRHGIERGASDIGCMIFQTVIRIGWLLILLGPDERLTFPAEVIDDLAKWSLIREAEKLTSYAQRED